MPACNRICLRCNKPFYSKGNHNRICNFCNRENLKVAKTAHKIHLPSGNKKEPE